MREILLLPNPGKELALQLCIKIIDHLRDYSLNPYLEEKIALAIDRPGFGRSEAQLFDKIDLVLVLGGDGSMLNAARRVYPRQIPLLGINMGHLGFLTRVESNKLENAFEQLIQGNYLTEERSMLEAEVIRDGKPVINFVALNDLVVSKGSLARIIRLETWIDGEYFTTYPADGLIVASATGSTAYSLSAGGPIMDPGLKAILITPICAHSLYARSLVLNDTAVIKVLVNANHTDITLTADGQTAVTLLSGDEIHFKKAKAITKLLRFNHQGVYEVLQSRLKEGRI